MVNLSKLSNLSPLEFNNTIVNNTDTIIPQMAANANVLSGNYWGLAVMVSVYIIVFWYTFKDDGAIRLDFLRSTMVASGFSFIVGLLGIISTLFTSFVHVMWFFAVFVGSVVWLYAVKKQGF